MTEGRVDDEMIEIGDPTEEPTAEESSPQVVIQYHERGGVPWMLIPPLLAIAAVGAILLYSRLSPRVEMARVPAPALINPIESLPSDNELTPPSQPTETPSRPLELPEKPFEASPPVVATTPVESVSPPAGSAGPDKVVDPAPFPRVQSLGFDPKALEAERKVEAPADAAIAPAVREDRPAEVDPDAGKPREVDPDLLPPDPREAKIRQQQRKLEVFKKVEDERSQFHAALKAICRKFGENSGPEIDELQKHFDVKIDPTAEKLAMKLLGKNGKFAGADRRKRIEVLRSIGYPEPVILGDLLQTYGKQRLNERNGPRTFNEALYDSALFLIRNPPPVTPGSSRAVPDTSNGRTAAASSNPGNVVGPAR